MERRIECLERIVREQQEEMERLKGALTRSKSPIMTAAKAVRAKSFSISAPTNATLQLNVNGPILNRNVNRNLPFNATPVNIRLYDETGTGDHVPEARKRNSYSSNLSSSVRPQSAPNSIHRSSGPGNIVRLAVSNPPIEKKRHLSPNNCSRAVSIINKRKNAVEGTKTFARTLPIKQIISKPDGNSKLCRGGLKQLRALKAVKNYIEFLEKKRKISSLTAAFSRPDTNFVPTSVARVSSDGVPRSKIISGSSFNFSTDAHRKDPISSTADPWSHVSVNASPRLKISSNLSASLTSRVSANAGYDSSTSSSSGSGSICSSSSNSSSSNSTNSIKRPVIASQIRSVSALASITDKSSIRPVMTSSSSSLSLSHREASSSNQRSKLCTKRVDGHAARADAISRIDRNKHDMREDLSEGPHLSYDSFRGSASRNLSIIGEKNMETENVREIERVKEIRSEQMANRHNENFDREKTRSVSYDSRLNFASTTNRLNVHSNTNPVSASYVGTSSPFSSSNSSSYSSSSSALPSSSPSSSFRMSITPSKSSQFSTFSANSSSSASSFYRASSSLSSSSSSSFYPSTSSLSSSGYPSSPFPISNYPCRSVSASSSFPSSSSSLNSVDFRSSSRSANTIYDMTTIDDSDDENEEEKQKRDRVIALIKSLTQLTDKQQMIKQILEKYQTKPDKTKRLINSGKAIFQDWLNVEVNRFSNDTNVTLLELILQVIDKATWSDREVSGLRVDRTIRQLYKACSSHPGSGSSSSSYYNLMSLSKEMWPRYRNIYKVYNSSTSALRNSTSTYGDEGVY